MKVLFAVSNENISESIIKKYQSMYKEIILGKNVYYFNAILKELQKDKSYDRIVISEDLEPFANKNYETIDNFIFEKLDSISDEAVTNSGDDIPIILISTDRRTKGETILNKIFGIGIYSALIGQDRSMEELCKLINKPRTKKEAKIYYKIDVSDVDYKNESEEDVSEIEIQNILTHYKRLGKNEDKYVESFNSIANQYTDEQLKVIIKFLPLRVKAVLEADCPKYQQIAAFSGESKHLKRQQPYNSSQINPKTSKERSKNDAINDNGIKIESINTPQATKLTKPVVIPAAVSTKNVKKVQNSNKVTNKPESKLENIKEEKKPEIKINNEEIIENKKGRGRPKKATEQEESKTTNEQPKKKRGRPKKVQAVEEKNNTREMLTVDIEDMLPGFEEETEEVLPGFEEIKESNEEESVLPGFEEIEDEEEDILPGFEEIEDEEEDILPGFEEIEDEEDILPGFEEMEEVLPEFEETTNKAKEKQPKKAEKTSEALLDFEDFDDSQEEEESNQDDNEEDENSIEIEKQDTLYRNKELNKNIEEKQISNYNENTQNNKLQNLLTSDKKIVAFVGTSKNGTSFLINNLANILSNQGIKTAILDLTKNRNSYYIYTKNEEELRKTAIECTEKLINGTAQGVPVNKNLDIYTSLPGENNGIEQYQEILSTLVQNYSLILLDCDFETQYSYLKESQEIYLVQSMDVLTIQPLTAYLRELKAKNVLEQNKLRIVINKYTKVRGVTERTIIGGMSFYNDPSMSFMTELFNRENIRYAIVPFEMQTYSKYLECLVNCNITTSGYSKDFTNSMKKLANMVYPLVVSAQNKYNNPKYNKYATKK